MAHTNNNKKALKSILYLTNKSVSYGTTSKVGKPMAHRPDQLRLTIITGPLNVAIVI